jgi:hypothetical protein
MTMGRPTRMDSAALAVEVAQSSRWPAKLG